MKYANKLNARFAVILGDSEVESGKVELKNMVTGEGRDIHIDTLMDRLLNQTGCRRCRRTIAEARG